MKTKYLIILGVLVCSLISFKSIHLIHKQSTLVLDDPITAEGIYDGHEDYGYNFIFKGEDDFEHTFTFQNVDESVLKTYDLNSETFVGAKFKVTYKTKIVVTKDADNYDEENEINTILKLEKL